MEHYAGIDVSLESVSGCVVDGTGRIMREAKLASEPTPLVAWFGALEVPPSRIGLETGPLSPWLYAAMAEAGLPVELLETRHVRMPSGPKSVVLTTGPAGVTLCSKTAFFTPLFKLGLSTTTHKRMPTTSTRSGTTRAELRWRRAS